MYINYFSNIQKIHILNLIATKMTKIQLLDIFDLFLVKYL